MLVARILFALLCVLALAPSAAQQAASELGTPPMQVWTTSETNLHRQLWRLRVLPGGRVLVGHGRGVGLFDGQRWEVLSTEGRTYVTEFLPTGPGRWLVATTSRLLLLAPDAQGRLSWQTLVDLRERPDVDFGGVYGLAETASGHLVLGPQRLVHVARDGRARVLVGDGQIRLLRRVGGRLVVEHATHGLMQVDEQDPARLLPLAGAEQLTGSRVRDLLPDADGSWLVATVRQGVLRWRPSGVEPVAGDLAAWTLAHPARKLLRLPDGALAVGSADAGVAVFDAQGRLRRQLDRRHGLPSGFVGDMALDAEGDLWLAMHDGVVRVQIGSRITEYGSAHAIEAVNALARHAGRLVLGTDQGLRVLDPGQAQPLPAVPALRTQTFALASLHGELFAGWSGGVHRVTGADGSIDQWRAERVASAPFTYGLLAERGGAARLFAATVRGLFIIERQDGRWLPRGPIPGVPATELQTMAQDEQGALWIGSRDGRAWRVRAADAAWTQLQASAYGAADGLPNGYVTPVGDPAGFFLATFHGPMRLGADGRFQVEPRLAALPRDRDGKSDWFRFLGTRRGELWSRIGPITGVARQRAGDGPDWDETVLRAFVPEVVYAWHEDDDGTVWIGRERSLLRVAVGTDPPPRPVAPQLRRIRAAQGEVLAADAALVGLSLAARHDALRLEFAWPDHRNTQRGRYRSQLEGHDAEYTPWSAETYRDVSGLRGGRYRLHIEAMDRFGRVVRAEPLDWHLAPPWYRGPLALGAYALLALAAAVALARAWAHRRTLRLESQRAELERMVSLRTDQLAGQAHRLEQLDVAKSQFYAGVTHEFRTPLMLILEPLRELADGVWGKLPVRAQEPLAAIGRNAQRVLALVNQLLDLHAADAGALPLAAREGDLSVFVQGIVAAFEPMARRRGVLLHADVEPAVTAWFDADLIESAVGNLLANAVKFTPSGGEVKLRLQRTDRQARLRVADTGPGVATDDRARLFEPFFRGRQAHGQPGTGIGLAVVRAAAERHRGQVLLVDGDGPGACFELRLPLGDAHLEAKDKAAPAERAAAAPSGNAAGAGGAELSADGDGDALTAPRTGTSVLIVDDNAELREFLAERLSTRFRVLQAGDGESGWRALRESMPDLMLSDVSMPVLDGFELCRRAKADGETAFIPIVLMASRETTAARVRGFEAGADDFVVKPFNTTELLSRLVALLASRRQLRTQLVQRAGRDAARAQPGEDPLQAAVRAALMQHLDDSAFGVAELARALHVDRTTLFKRLKAIGQPAPLQLLRELRLQAAAEMLRRAEGHVSEVAYACGFESLSHFSRSFKALYGCTPSEFATRARASRVSPELGQPPARAQRL